MNLSRVNISNHPSKSILQTCDLEGLDYQIDPYIGCEHHCYYCYALKYAETDWSKEVKIHHRMEDRLREELKKINPKSIYLGYHSDPYQPCEAKLFQTRRVLEILLESEIVVSLLTKSDLVLRDIDLLKKLNANVSFSIAFNDEYHRALFEEYTQPTEQRIKALERLKSAGIRTTAMLCPVIPNLNNPLSLVHQLKNICDSIWVYGIALNDDLCRSNQNVKHILEDHFWNQKNEIMEIIRDREHPYWMSLRDELAFIQKHEKIDLRIHV